MRLSPFGPSPFVCWQVSSLRRHGRVRPGRAITLRSGINQHTKKEKTIVNITLKSGLNALSVNIEDGATVGSVLSNPNYAAALGYDASNVEGVVNGIVASSEARLFNGDTLLAQKKAHSKA